ncbi:AsnC family protein [Salmonella enterica]|nr:AsnC family protein [Salmonella enterica]
MILSPMGIPGVCPAHCRAWTPEEDKLLISLHGKKTLSEIAALLPAPGRVKSATQARVGILRERYPDKVSYICRPYTLKEDNLIRKNCHTMTVAEVAACLNNRTPKSVKGRAKKMGVSFRRFGERHPNAKYPDGLVIRVQDWRDTLNLTFSEIDRKLGLPRLTAWYLYHRRLTADYAIVRELLP